MQEDWGGLLQVTVAQGFTQAPEWHSAIEEGQVICMGK
jgi:hypothetical protein